jgi:uncharacterized membrane protein YgaE (UPF0421/DUF939 family)
MKAALSTRPASDLNAQYAALQQSNTQNTTNAGPASGQTTYTQIAIFEGAMLDARVSVTYFAMMGLFVYLLARVRVQAPKLTLVAIFGTIVADVYVTTAPLIPTFSGTLPKTFLVPVGIATGVGVLCNVVIFPQSTSNIVLEEMDEVFVQMRTFGRALGVYLGDPDKRFEIRKLIKLRDELLASYNSIDTSSKFLPMDFSYGRWSPSDIIALQKPFREVFVAFGELLQVPMAREQARIRTEVLGKFTNEEIVGVGEKGKEGSKVATHQIARTLGVWEHMKHPDSEGLMQESYATLSTSIGILLPAWRNASEYISRSLIGSARVDKRSPGDLLKDLEVAQVDFEREASKRLIDLHEHLLDGHGNVIAYESGHGAPLLGLMTGLLYVERLGNCSKATHALLEQMAATEETRQKSRLWLPKGLMNLFSWALSKDDAPSTVQNLQRTTTSTSKQKRSKKHSRSKKKDKKKDDPNTAAARLQEIRKPTGRRRHKSSALLLAVITWFTNDAGLHALRTLVLTIALALPAVLTSSAGFYYREKGLWALIMAQLGLMPFSSDFIAGLITRVLGTIIGGVVGLACWYIGSGSGPGNAYGLAAVMAVVIVATMYWRLFAPPEQMQASIMTAATAYLVVAYSWVDTHIPSYGNPGVGYTVFWRRLLLVLVGFGAGVVVTFFPRPPSGNRHYRHELAQQLGSIKDRYALFVSTWRSPPEDLAATVEKEALESEELLTEMAGPIKLTKFEFSSSNIDTKTLSYVCHFCTTLNVSITQLVLYSQRLSSEQRAKFMHDTRAVDEEMAVDIMAVLTLLQNALEAGTALPAVLPTPLVRHVLLREPEARHGVTKVEVMQALATQGTRHWISALNAYMRLLSAVDDLAVVLKQAVGEQNKVDLSVFSQSV